MSAAMAPGPKECGVPPYAALCRPMVPCRQAFSCMCLLQETQNKARTLGRSSTSMACVCSRLCSRRSVRHSVMDEGADSGHNCCMAVWTASARAGLRCRRDTHVAFRSSTFALPPRFGLPPASLVFPAACFLQESKLPHGLRSHMACASRGSVL